MRIDKNSYGTLALVVIVCAAIASAMFFFCSQYLVDWCVLAFLVAVCVWQFTFFRVPKRNIVGDERKVTAVADGKIVIIDRVFEPEFLGKDCIMVSIYMNFWDVHANFWPVSGEVSYYRYHPGKHHLAFRPKASEQNEHTCVGIRTEDGKDVFFKQIAGTFARRIVCYARPGMKVKAGMQCGIIKFGSRIDMFLPLDADIKTSLGVEPRACESVIAELV